MRALIYTIFLLSVCIIKSNEAAFEETAEPISFFDLFPTLFRLKRSLIENGDDFTESQESTQRYRPPPSQQFEQYLFQVILQAHSLSLGDLRNFYVQADGEPKIIVEKLNEAIGKELLHIDDENFLKINCDVHLLFFNGYISQISKENPYLDTLLNNVLKPYISKLQVNVDEFRVPIDTILERVKPHLKRNKRSLNAYNQTYYEVAEEDGNEVAEEDGNEATDIVRNLLQLLADWLRDAAKHIIILAIVQLNIATYGLFLPAFELLQSFLLGIIDSIKLTI